MKNRVGLLAAIVLILGSVIILWTPREWNVIGPAPIITPRAARPPDPPITNSFGSGDALPKELDDDTFWKIISQFSEPDGYFRYENFLSNENSYQDPIPALRKAAKPGGVYVGVGPEQNFTYIAAIRPQMAFIVDIRRQNMIELLMYKALFEMAANRADFVAFLFARRRPKDLDENSTAQQLFDAYRVSRPDRNLFEQNLQRIKDQLPGLSAADRETIASIYNVFFSVGPDLTYSSVSPAPAGPSYERLMTLTDAEGHNWSYLASENNFRFVKELQRRNLIIPIVGDFAGPKAIRTVGRYVKDHRAIVSAFYLSNVEMYILPSAQWKSFCANVAALPVDESSMFIRFVLGGYGPPSFRFGAANRFSAIGPMIDVLTGVTTGYPPSYYDLLHASR